MDLLSVVIYGNRDVIVILLRMWRERRGYSVRELAKRAGVGFVTVSRIENGHMSPTVAMLETLAKALNIHITALFSPPRRRR
jgi:transcriptional regulator with XRE-family HTH domain